MLYNYQGSAPPFSGGLYKLPLLSGTVKGFFQISQNNFPHKYWVYGNSFLCKIIPLTSKGSARPFGLCRTLRFLFQLILLSDIEVAFSRLVENVVYNFLLGFNVKLHLFQILTSPLQFFTPYCISSFNYRFFLI